MFRKCLLIFLSITGLLSFRASANNIDVTNLGLSDQNTSSDYTMVSFDISWDNSWRTGSAPNNWDAAWVFVKYREQGSTTWYHATLNTSGHTAPSGSTIDTPSDGKGVFIYRSSNGTGTFSLTGVELQWDYGTDGLADDAMVEVRVYAIEMVYVPQGAFALGSGGTENGAFYKYPTTTDTYSVASEGAITVGTASGNLYYPSTAYSGDQSGPIPAAFPKGYAAFYCMKYEVSQEQYVAFLNTLTRTQQNTRTQTNVSGTSITDVYVMGPSPSTTVQYRNGIRCDATLPASPTPITFYCDYNGNGTGDESDDGQNITCNFLSSNDLKAYLDWSGLRPFTELEFEKACRGTASPVANERAWGTTSYASSAYTLSNAGSANEGIATNYSTTAGNVTFSSTNGSIVGPLRQGIFAANGSNTGRVTSGATYYGIMEMSGNVWEKAVTVGEATGRAYTGAQGDGTLNASGDADVTNWPATDCVGMGFRGGDRVNGSSSLRVSDRGVAVYSATYRDTHVGGRGVRTAP
ncbi:MAG: SUMF1/EgtB/PvdO family nonheme iron enzyme [Flavobacteriales bacterium]|nr:SUMF1/EgtB/PvdO family nonheme iron enzyme [Flavobacteriales bacterium]MCB9447255.1 SUMF1/EgtB/PvdO family nonheme iron enzyme [Flavobacteriales bacterium]